MAASARPAKGIFRISAVSPKNRPMLQPASDRYRPDIDGLRAVAVLAVVAFHAFPETVRGGFVGVDIFFVISGFLITGIVARELGEKRFYLATFYARRVRRIFPALIVVLIAVLILGWLWMLPGPYAQLSSDVFASAAFAANITLWLQSGYFDVEAAKKPLLHLWSLGIEEQFYLIWPLVLMLAARLRLSLVRLALAGALISFALNVALIDKYPVATFYLPFTRAWELLAGGVLACAWSRIDQGEGASNLRAAAGAVLIAIAILALDPTRAFPGWWAALPVAGSALILSAPMAWGCRRLLASRSMVFFGLISYPLYLWHWPLLVFFSIIKFKDLTTIERLLVVGLSILLAWVTWRFVEIPFRFGRPRLLKVASLAGAMALVALLGVVVVRNDGFDLRLPPEIRAMAQVTTQAAKWRVHQCMLDLVNGDTSFADTCVDRGRRPLLFVWGDSTAGSLMPGLLKAQQSRDFAIAQYTASSCAALLNVDVPGVPRCRAVNDRVLALARELQPDIVLLHGFHEKFIDNMADTVAALKQNTRARVVVLGPEPLWKRGLPNGVLRYYMLHRHLIPERINDDVSSNGVDARLRARLEPLGAEVISAWDVMCNAEGCLARLGDEASDISASDMIHLTEKGSEFLIDAVIDRVLNGPRASTARAVN
jgi:peptidoglycan/LPS O-acetylase OafA/YrhL